MSESNDRKLSESMTVVSQETTFLATCALLFLASAAATLRLCTSMSGGMPMPGGWTMSMVWMKMPGQSSTVAAVIFL